ncbi:Lethal(2) giant larvae sro7 [Coemansia sp. RSA 2050]|nr:Lethal(2) giant larvae sro7 [Coemansia sp. RSA 2050]KAJ2736009.1 Lethal(2) giant larvae sro7 [Coemansia sp. BCRC 34962]
MDAGISAAPAFEGRLVDPAVGATAVGADPTQGVLAVGYKSGRIDLFSSKRPTCAHLHIGLPGAVQHLKLVPGQPFLAAIDSHGVLRVFDTDTLQLCFSYSVPSPPTCMSLLPGTRWLLIGTEMGRVYFVNSGEGLKSDFSIGSLVQPPSRVVSAEPHPVETEKILIAYAEGTCVVCDLGKGSLSERHMVVSKHRYEHLQALKQSMRRDLSGDDHFGAPYADLVEPQLTGASWSPSGDQIATAYTNGVFCVFDASSDPEPVVARTIVSEDIGCLNVADLERNARCLKYVRWCTHASSDQSFLAITSGPAASYQQVIHVFGTGVQGSIVKSNSDIVACERYSLDASIGSLVPIPRLSPWRNECEGVSGLAVLVGKQAVVQMLGLGPKLRLQPAAEQLPGELVWSAAPATLVCLAQGDLDPVLRSLLAPIQRSHLHQFGSAAVPDHSAARPNHDDMQVFCGVDGRSTLSLWCIYNDMLRPCASVEFDLKYASWVLGIEGHVSAVDIRAHSGLVVLGMDSGEALISVLHNGAHPLPLAPHSMSTSEIREQAAEYYFDKPDDDESGAGEVNAERAAAQTAQEPQTNPEKGSTGLGSAAQGDLPVSALPKDLAAIQRSRAMSVSDRSFIRRSSKRVSSSISTLFRRGARPRSTGGSYTRPSSGRIQEHEESLEAGMLGLSMSAVDRSSGNGLTRPIPIDIEAWKSQQTAVNTELSCKLYGLQLDAVEQYRMGGASSRTKPVSRPRIDSGAPALADNGNVQPGMSPLMLTRFFRRKVINVAAGPDGIVALVYAGGVLVAIDCPRQRVLLADNINQAPSSEHTARDVFFGTRSPTQAMQWPMKDAEVTAVSVVRLGRDIAHGSLGDTGFGDQASLLVGTSQGCVLAYTIADAVAPPVVVERSRTGAILYMDDYPCRPGHFHDDAARTDCAQALVVGSQSAVTVHSAKTLGPITSHVLPTRASAFVAVRIVELPSGWHGVVAVDCQANVTLLTLPRLERVQVAPIPEARSLIASAVVQISSSGLIILLGPDGVLLQARVVDSPSQHGVSVSDGLSQQSMFDVDAKVPPLPVRKGITSWLFGKTSNASQDIDMFLGGHCRDLLARGGIKPGMRLQQLLAPQASGSALPTGVAAEADRAVDDVGKAVDLDGALESKNMLDKRGQQLEMIDERVQQASMQARGFLDDIRAYNAKQAKGSKKRFGLF